MNKKQQSERDEYISKLRATLKPGDTLHTVLRQVSRTGMSRVIDVYHFRAKRGKVERSWLSYWIAKACGFTFSTGRPEGIKIGDCGMDMGFKIVYNLGRTLYPKGVGCSGENYQSNDHTNGDLSRVQHSKSNPHWQSDGGYAFRHEWL
jgi:hypothetical protein